MDGKDKYASAGLQLQAGGGEPIGPLPASGLAVGLCTPVRCDEGVKPLSSCTVEGEAMSLDSVYVSVGHTASSVDGSPIEYAVQTGLGMMFPFFSSFFFLEGNER